MATRQRRQDAVRLQLGAASDGGDARYFDPGLGMTVVRIQQGECYATTAGDELLTTVLGSCVAACIRDPVLGLGGMNHFMLPESESGDWLGGVVSAAARYGNFAMEKLINIILSQGGQRDRLEVKVFGGANLFGSHLKVGHQNAEFVERYLREEGLALASSHLRGQYPRALRYFPTTGRVQMKELLGEAAGRVANEERQRRVERPVVAPVAEGDVELFG